MAYAYNRSAFEEAARFPNPLISLYASLIHLELVLKTHDADLHRYGHDVCRMLEGFERVSSLALQLRNNLCSLRCVDKEGSSAAVLHSNYPAIRYLRHRDDHPDEDVSNDHDLRIIVGIIDDIKTQLRKNKNLRPYL